MAYQQFNPFAELPTGTDGDVAALLAQLGWEDFLNLGEEDSNMCIQTWSRTVEGRNQYLLEVSDYDISSPYIRVDTFPELMDLLARWAPAVQGANILSLVADIRKYGLSTDGVLETIAAKAAFGVDDGLDRLRRHEREQAEHRRQAVERVRAARARDGHVPTNERVEYPGGDA